MGRVGRCGSILDIGSPLTLHLHNALALELAPTCGSVLEEGLVRHSSVPR